MTAPPCPTCLRLRRRCSTCAAKQQPALTIPLQIALAVVKATKETTT